MEDQEKVSQEEERDVEAHKKKGGVGDVEAHKKGLHHDVEAHKRRISSTEEPKKEGETDQPDFEAHRRSTGR